MHGLARGKKGNVMIGSHNHTLRLSSPEGKDEGKDAYGHFKYVFYDCLPGYRSSIEAARRRGIFFARACP